MNPRTFIFVGHFERRVVIGDGGFTPGEEIGFITFAGSPIITFGGQAVQPFEA